MLFKVSIFELMLSFFVGSITMFLLRKKCFSEKVLLTIIIAFIYDMIFIIYKSY